MVNDSIQAPLNSVELFDQDLFDQDSINRDSVQGSAEDAVVTAVEVVRDGNCQACHVGDCANCVDTDCQCPHAFVVIGRAIVELDASLQRTNELLERIGRSSGTTEHAVPIESEDPRPVPQTTHAPSKARRGLGRKKSNR